jgi:hypothetical protein
MWREGELNDFNGLKANSNFFNQIERVQVFIS